VANATKTVLEKDTNAKPSENVLENDAETNATEMVLDNETKKGIDHEAKSSESVLEKDTEAKTPPKKRMMEKFSVEKAANIQENPCQQPAEVVQKSLIGEDQDENVCRQNSAIQSEAKKAIKVTKQGHKRSAHEEAMKLGRRKSGRVWKGQRDRFKSVVKPKGLKQDAKVRLALKQERLRVREFEKALKEEKKQELEEKRKRQEENKKRKLENERKNEVLQQIKNPAKIKRMKKKQLRMLAKRDLTPVVNNGIKKQ